MKAIIGLGNPGDRYAGSRHNLGFMVVDRLAARWKAPKWQRRHQAQVAKVSLPEGQILLVKPQTYMNNSGTAVREIAASSGIPQEDLLVIYDDLDLEVGQLRLRRKGSAGGHKGVSSIISCLGTDDFHRLRVGIGKPPPGVEVVDYVLGDFPDKEWEIIEKVVASACEAALVWVKDGIDEAMARFNGLYLKED
ncbi:MAG: aminoacyl-tRNA hydrolase [Firmicutes bacterium]|nr:aminoacyl-tRNA hydrolase [Bacillota bacterium]